MALTDHEQRAVDQIERQLAAQDPKFAARLTRPAPWRVLSRKTWLVIGSLVTYVTGLLVVIAGVTSSSAAVVVLGAVVSAAGAADLTRRAARSVRSSGHDR